ncbi:MAG TPA: flagellar assembly protein FliW [Candidatus Hydrogenedentes bacterium]|nr:flagellar assembly protein FliW [Candidatus Hydrogenedentota bacterium]HPG67656.1 flagellar assembly protein FliW [Candidatus Hydrogenedentota bacterium]
MQLETTRFGIIEVAEDSVITFTQPIVGFQNYRRFILLPGPEGSVVKWLQSVEVADLAFILMDPRLVVPDYDVPLSRSELDELAVTGTDGLDIYTLLVVPTDHTKIRTNLKAPVLINATQRLAKQTILERSDYPIQFFLAQAQQSDEEHKEVQHARSDS